MSRRGGWAAPRILFALAAILHLWVSFAPAAMAADPAFPALSGRVVDAASIIPSDTRARIEAKLKAFEDKTTDQVVVATVPSLGDLDLDEYANKLFRAWGLGQKDKNNGVLLLIAPKEHKMRIETGYGLEGTLTDAVSSTIINTVIGPKFRKGDFGGGVEAGVDQIIAILGSDADAAGGGQGAAARFSSGTPNLGPLLLGILPFAFFVIVVLIIFWPRRPQTGARHHRSSSGLWTTWNGPSWGSGGSSSSSWGSSDGGFSGGGGSSGGGGASGSW